MVQKENKNTGKKRKVYKIARIANPDEVDPDPNFQKNPDPGPSAE